MRTLSFTDSTGVGRGLLAEASKTVVSCAVELGGKAPFVVMDDTMITRMRNASEACTAANRIYVQAGTHNAFVNDLSKRMAALKVGPGYETGVRCNPRTTAKDVVRIDALVSDPVGRGTCKPTGGKPIDGDRFYYPPTVPDNLPPESHIAHEEIFGPVAPIYRFEIGEEAIRLANDTGYGLAAYVYSRDLSRALRVAAGIETGMVGIKTKPDVAPLHGPVCAAQCRRLGCRSCPLTISGHPAGRYLPVCLRHGPEVTNGLATARSARFASRPQDL